MEKGMWVKYSNPNEVATLVSNVSKVAADWKIKYENVAEYNLSDGIVYVYYTEDQNGDYTIPRLYILSNKQGRVSLAEGITKGENIEDNMLDILDAKLDEINDKKFLHKPRVADLKLLEQIYNKTMQGVELTIDEIKFLYEFYREIKYFGFSKDDRVAVLRKIRDTKADMNRVFRMMDDYEGDFVLNIPSYVKGIVFPKHIRGNFVLKKTTSLSDCVLPEVVEGNIELPKVKKINNVLFGENVAQDVDIRNLIQTDHVIFPKYVGGDFLADNLREAKKTIFPKEVCGRTMLICLGQSYSDKIRIYGIGDIDRITASPYNFVSSSEADYQVIADYIINKLSENQDKKKHVR